MRKQLDPRIPILINNNVKLNHRSFIVLVGDKGRDQIVNLHFLLSQARVSARPSVLWCYKKDLGFTTHRKKREAKIKREVKKGMREPNEQNPFEIFVTVTDIRYTYYKESEKILGNTYGMLVLQDFEAITPNLLARTIETVEGGGLVVLLLKTMSSLKQLYTMTMDVHSRYRTSSHDSVVARFNERFILSLGACTDCLVLDDELNVLPISKGKDIQLIEDDDSEGSGGKGKGKMRAERQALKDLQESLSETKPAGDLVKLAKTTDQAQAILTFIEAIAEKTLSSTVTLTAGRGRGKSAALGLAMAAALAHGYSNIFVTSPSPENLKTVFEFVFKGMDALGYEEHLDYDIVQSTNPEFGKAIVRVNIFKGHRQTIQYIQPQDAHVLGQAELVVIDEAAAIPLPLVRNLIGPYLVFMASTINGYEGTGRSLSLKLIQQLRESTRPSLTRDAGASSNDASTSTSTSTALAKSKNAALAGAPAKARSLREIKLEMPIRYSPGDNVEKWLNSLLCLDAAITPGVSKGIGAAGCPHPSQCELFYVNRDTLFSFHPASEVFLQRMMALYVASHYKNQPNDLQLMSDAPHHQLFVLLPPMKDQESSDGITHLPEPLVVLQVALEGNVSREAILEGLGRGVRPGGDMIPWIVSQQFQESRFGRMSGARVVRVACHPEYAGMGYGSRSIQALNEYFSGEYVSLDEEMKDAVQEYDNAPVIDPSTDLLTDKPTVRAPSEMPPLLQRLSERRPESLDYLGVSYGLTPQLLRFWKRAKFVPLYLRQTQSELTGEHTCVMVRGLNSSKPGDLDWLNEFAKDFRRRFLTLLSYKFREFGSVTALSVLEAVNAGIPKEKSDVVDEESTPKASNAITSPELNYLFTPFDFKRLESYANNSLDFHVVQDLFPSIAQLYFNARLGDATRLTAVQASILLALGLQRKTVEDVEKELSLPVNQCLALLVKMVRKLGKKLAEVRREEVEKTLPAPAAGVNTIAVGQKERGDEWKTVGERMEKELEEAGDDVQRELREKQRAMLESLDLRK
ncbi:DUF699-domain-containing protein [Coprinellus micaceus]|uniref:RNA cytidine acetyltransferase n=1 Tax=Coprinellus micaceus TaxID=71717 RepID=A0A4Y7T272_COPMI|nr:DUF699-domain-containing protein [Coprinellus micaceus]